MVVRYQIIPGTRSQVPERGVKKENNTNPNAIYYNLFFSVVLQQLFTDKCQQ
jgi:hypothetical protein